MPTAYADRTLDAYAAYASKASENWGRLRPPKFLRRFARGLRPGARVLDYGCGIGVELAWLRSRGFAAEGIDGTRAFVREARRRSPGAAIQLCRFEDARLAPAAYDGIWCQAALIHVPPAEMRRQLRMLRSALSPGGWLALTLAWGRTRAYTRRDWIPGRYFAAYTKPQALAMLRGWRVLHASTISHDGRRGRWIQMLAQASG